MNNSSENSAADIISAANFKYLIRNFCVLKNAIEFNIHRTFSRVVFSRKVFVCLLTRIHTFDLTQVQAVRFLLSSHFASIEKDTDKLVISIKFRW